MELLREINGYIILNMSSGCFTAGWNDLFQPV